MKTCFFIGHRDAPVEILQKENGRQTSPTRVNYSLPNNQSTETFNISANVLSSISDTGRFCPSSNDSAGTLISTPANCNLASSSTCFIPCALRASVTLAPIMFRLPNSNFLGFICSPPSTTIICLWRVDLFGITKYNENIFGFAK